MARFQRAPLLNFQADDVWAAACAAQRINGSYVKQVPVDQKGDTNRQIVDMFLGQPDLIQQCDRDLGEKVRNYYKGFTFKILKGIKLSDFDNTAMLIANRDVIASNYDLAVICSLPASYERGAKRDQLNQRLAFANGGNIGVPGNKIRIEGAEVIKCNFSQQYNTFFVTCITKEDQVVFFALRKDVPVGQVVNIEGTVKMHRDSNTTQLNRAKVYF
jgi:hypothetical protein